MQACHHACNSCKHAEIPIETKILIKTRILIKSGVQAISSG
jgi:hypothetical protein